MRIPDALDLHRIHEAKQERELARFPLCTYCLQPITEDRAIRIDDEWWHTDCMIEQFEVSVEEF